MSTVLNLPYRKKPYVGTSILDDQINLQGLYQGVAIFYHSILHKKIGEVLEVVYGEYPIGEYFFIPPHDYLITLYDSLVETYLEIDRRPDFCELPLIEVRAFLHLRGDFHYDIQSWAESKEEFFKDDAFLAKRVHHPYPIAPDLELAFQRLDEGLTLHKEKKDKLLHKIGDKILRWHDLVLHKSKATLTYKDNSPVSISFSNPIKLLIFLLDNKGNVSEYTAIAKKLQLNAYSEDSTNKDLARTIQLIKKELIPILMQAGMSGNEIKNMIQTITNTGYLIK